MNLGLKKIDIDEIRDILKDRSDVFCFGSRVLGTHSKFSDLDLCIKADIGIMDLVRLKGQFNESNLLIKIDLSIYSDLPDYIKEKVDRDGINFNEIKADD